MSKFTVHPGDKSCRHSFGNPDQSNSNIVQIFHTPWMLPTYLRGDSVLCELGEHRRPLSENPGDKPRGCESLLRKTSKWEEHMQA
eukprot:1185526-Prorocentrum_minimum.AAC.8